MKKYFLFFLAFSFSLLVFPNEQRISQLKTECAKEKAATLSTLIIPRSCHQLNEELQQREKQNAPDDKENMTYEWDGHRYCYFNQAREPVSCFNPPDYHKR